MKAELIEKYGMLPEGTRVLCAVSGGADSMCLLHWLKSMERERGISVAAAHFEHGLRGDESLRDCCFVQGWCAENGIECVVEHGNVRTFAEEKGIGTEEAARILRYEFLHRAAEKLGCDRIAVAHNANDNAETVIFNLTRGAGTTGMRGIPPVRGEIIRPLLEATRREIIAYLTRNNIPHVEDSSNQSDDYSRNIIRHNVIPVLEKLNPFFAAAFGRGCELLRQDEECLDSMAKGFIAAHYDGESLPAKELLELNRAVSSRVIRILLERALEMTHVEAVLNIAGSTELAYASVPGRRIRCERGRLYFKEEVQREIIPREIVMGQTTEFPEAGFSVTAEFTVQSKEIHNSLKTYCFKSENICGKIICTAKKPGDSIRPHGRGCTKSLKSLFAEAGYTAAQRAAAPVFRDDEGIIAVANLAMAERVVPIPGDRVIKIEIKKIETGR